MGLFQTHNTLIVNKIGNRKKPGRPIKT